MDAEFGRRLRAARGYAGLSRPQLAERLMARDSRLGVSATTIKRIEQGDEGVKGETADWAQHVAAVCEGVPVAFLTEGWTPFTERDEIMSLLEHSLDAIRNTIRGTLNDLLRANPGDERRKAISSDSEGQR